MLLHKAIASMDGGVMAFKVRDPGMALVAVHGCDAAGSGRSTVRLPRESVGYAQPVVGDGLRAVLGAAGRAVGPAQASAPLSVSWPAMSRTFVSASGAVCSPLDLHADHCVFR